MKNFTSLILLAVVLLGCKNNSLNTEIAAENTLSTHPKSIYIPIEFDINIIKNPEIVFCGLAEKELFEAEILQLVNQYRSQGSVCGDTYYPPTMPLKWNQSLFHSSIINSIDMAKSNLISHTNVDGKEVADKFRLSSYTFSIAMENIAVGHSHIIDVMTAWKQSPGHCKNMMDARITEIAAACTYKKESFYKYYWTMHLGAPITSKPKIEKIRGRYVQ